LTLKDLLTQLLLPVYKNYKLLLQLSNINPNRLASKNFKRILNYFVNLFPIFYTNSNVHFLKKAHKWSKHVRVPVFEL